MSNETEVASSEPPAPEGLWGWVTAPFSWLYCLLKILWLCGVSVVMLVLGAAIFISNDQGQDVLRMLVDPVGLRHPLRIAIFVGSVVCWSLATWYTSRMLLLRRLPGFPLPAQRSGPLREWVPRILGAFPPAIIAAAFGYLDAAERSLAAGFSALAVLLFLFYWARRKLVPAVRKVSPQAQLETLPLSTTIILIVALVLSFALLGLFVAHPVNPARFLGAASILVLAGTSMLLFFSIVLTYLPLAGGYPSLVLLVFLWSAFCSRFNDNHFIRTARSPAAAASPPAAPATSQEREAALQESFQQWLRQVQEEARASGAQPPSPDRPYPIFIVAAAGGGIRAAYWSAAVLAHTAERVGKVDTWRQHLFAMSGVSGGALGISVHEIQLQQGKPVDAFLKPAEAMLGQDHIAPVLAYLLFPDMVQRFWITPIASFDRARALESSWELSGHQYLGGQAFARPFLDLWKSPRHVLPALLLNSLRVETGQRVIVSSLPISADFVDAIDLLRPARQSDRQDLRNITLSAAVHLSARFAYVSPAARVQRTDGSLWGRLVDGGYFESSGAVTAGDLVRAICPDWSTGRTEGGRGPVCSQELAPSFGRIIPIVLLIKNDPEAASLCDSYPQSDGATGFFTELKPPVDALLATRDARARVAQRSIVRLIEGHDRPSGDCDDGCVLELSLAPRDRSDASREADLARNQYNDPPLGWSLSESSRAAMDRRFNDADIQGQMECIADLAAGKPCTTAQRCNRRGPLPRPTEPGAVAPATSKPVLARLSP